MAPVLVAPLITLPVKRSTDRYERRSGQCLGPSARHHSLWLPGRHRAAVAAADLPGACALAARILNQILFQLQTGLLRCAQMAAIASAPRPTQRRLKGRTGPSSTMARPVPPTELAAPPQAGCRAHSDRFFGAHKRQLRRRSRSGGRLSACGNEPGGATGLFRAAALYGAPHRSTINAANVHSASPAAAKSTRPLWRRHRSTVRSPNRRTSRARPK